MRFRTPSATRPPPEDGWSRPSRVRRQHSQQCGAQAGGGGGGGGGEGGGGCGGGEGGGRTRQPRQPSRSAPQRERRGEPDGAVAGETSRGCSHHQHPHSPHSSHSSHSSQAAPQHKHRRNVDPEPQPPARGKQQRHRSHVRQSEPSAGLRRETRRRERSCDSATTSATATAATTVHCPLCDGRFPA